MQGVIVPAEMPQEEVEALLNTPAVHNQVEQVTTKEVYTLGDGKYNIAVLDFGIKQNIINFLLSFDARLTVFPAFTSPEEVKACILTVCSCPMALEIRPTCRKSLKILNN